MLKVSKKIRVQDKKASLVQPNEARKQLEQKAVKGAKKALNEYRRVFERLAEFDRA